mgnify:CR=1 FL=1
MEIFNDDKINKYVINNGCVVLSTFKDFMYFFFHISTSDFSTITNDLLSKCNFTNEFYDYANSYINEVGCKLEESKKYGPYMYFQRDLVFENLTYGVDDLLSFFESLKEVVMGLSLHLILSSNDIMEIIGKILLYCPFDKSTNELILSGVKHDALMYERWKNWELNN